jgi:PAS domain S-box-containing protein
MATVARLPSIYFEKLLESSPDIVVAVDRRGTITFYNDGARQTLGYTPDEVLGQHVTRLYPDLAEARKVMAAMRQGRNCETTFVTKSGVHIPVLIAGSIIRDAGGQELGSIGFAKDLRATRRHDQLTEMAHGSEYATREYLPGTQMTDLRAAAKRCDDGRPAALAPHDPALSGIRILVVDDDLGVCQSLRDLLTQEGCEVLVATGGREGIARLESSAVDLVLSDVVMPDLDGYQLFQEVSRRWPGLPVVLMTAFHFDKDHIIQRSRQAGLADVIYKKPIDPPRLREIIKRHARRVQAAAG